jgi:hypothetical protein
MHYFYYLKIKTKQEIWFKDTPEDGARLASKHVG